MCAQYHKFSPLGDRALNVELGNIIAEELNNEVLSLCRALEELRVPGILEIQPAYSSLAIHFDPNVVGAPYIENLVLSVSNRLSSQENPPAAGPSEHHAYNTGETAQIQLRNQNLLKSGSRIVEIPVHYGGEDGPDLGWASEHLGASQEEIIKRHSSKLYRVYMIGFTPGFPYLGGMDDSIALPRLSEPRKVVPKGSVGIAGKQTGVYPWDTPGGWRLIGRTTLELFSLENHPPSLLQPGDYVKFAPIESPEVNWPADSKNNGQASSSSIMSIAVDAFLVEDPGLLTMVVDSGRFGYRKLGVPVSGAADAQSYSLANLLCDNMRNQAVLEFTLKGPVLIAQMDLSVAVTGAPAPITVDGVEMPPNTCFPVRKGQRLEVGPVSHGTRGYMAVAGGIQVVPVLGSRSTYLKSRFGGYQGRPLKSGDVLKAGPAPAYSAMRTFHLDLARSQFRPLNFEVFTMPYVTLKVIPGPEHTKDALKILSSEVYQVRPESDRMGIRFEGPRLLKGGADIISAPVVPGTVQVASDGRPMLLLADSQTTGGYKRVATVVSQDLPIAAQLRAGAKVRFRTIHC